MNLQEFRLLDTPEGDQDQARKNWVANVILGQNGRLHRGDDMEGPCAMMLNGKRVPFGETVSSVVRQISVQQLNGHPWLDLNIGSANYLHMLSVEMYSPFEDFKIGDLVRLTFEEHTSVDVPLTQEMIDKTTIIRVRYGLSR